jgi:transcription initiation factor IIE alpha subunit
MKNEATDHKGMYVCPECGVKYTDEQATESGHLCPKCECGLDFVEA